MPRRELPTASFAHTASFGDTASTADSCIHRPVVAQRSQSPNACSDIACSVWHSPLRPPQTPTVFSMALVSTATNQMLLLPARMAVLPRRRRTRVPCAYLRGHQRLRCSLRLRKSSAQLPVPCESARPVRQSECACDSILVMPLHGSSRGTIVVAGLCIVDACVTGRAFRCTGGERASQRERKPGMGSRSARTRTPGSCAS